MGMYGKKKIGMRFAMEEIKLVEGGIYRHFKGGIYQIKTLAKHSETGETMVVYQAMKPPFEVWVCPLSMFVERLDRSVYPDVGQKLRFVPVDLSEEMTLQHVQAGQTALQTGKTAQVGQVALQAQKTGQSVQETEGTRKAETQEQLTSIPDEELHRALVSGQAERYLSGKITEKEIARRGMLQILDAESYEEKRQLLIGMQPYLDKLLLHNIAAALDVVLDEAPLEEQFESLLHCVDAHARYEGGRLRP